MQDIDTLIKGTEKLLFDLGKSNLHVFLVSWKLHSKKESQKFAEHTNPALCMAYVNNRIEEFRGSFVCTVFQSYLKVYVFKVFNPFFSLFCIVLK